MSERTILLTPPEGNVGEAGPILHPDNDVWRPQSKRVGIKLGTYVAWNSFYAVMEFFNRALARDPNRKVSWDYWPPLLGLFYLLAKIRFARSNTLTDPYDYKSLDNNSPATLPPQCAHAMAADGQWVSDDQNAKMGASMTRFSSNIAPRKVRPDVEKISPSARNVAKMLRWRHLDSNNQEVVIPALILNIAAQAWIQFQFHGFGGNTLRDPINRNPYRMPRDPNEDWPNNEALIDRTTPDPTRVGGSDGRPTPINEKIHAWVQGQLYGNNEAELERLRTHDGKGAKLALDHDDYLPEDPSRPGIDLTGFSNNYSPYISFLHWLFTKEHNAIVDYYKEFHSDWDDERLFQYARKTNCAQIARIHTVEWTEDLLQHPTLQLGMHADWYGFLGQRVKCYLMRRCDDNAFINWVLTPLRYSDVLWGAPGSTWNHYDAPFQVPKQFRLVYRLHEMLLGKNDILDPKTGRLLDQINIIDFVHHHTRDQVKRFGYDTLGWSFVSKSCGALKLHNFPRDLTKFQRMQDNNLIDLSELDIFREREDGTGSYNDLRRSLGEPPVSSFLELTGGDADLAKEIETVYQGDINQVDAGIGILAEPKPAGFALGFVQFYQFVLNAPRRIKSNRFLSEGYTYKEYHEGLNWVEHGGGFKGAIRRHLPILADNLEGVLRGFAPWPETETFPERLLDDAQDYTSKAFLADMRTIGLLALSGGLAIADQLISFRIVLPILVLLLFCSSLLALTRLLTRRFLELCQKRCNTDRRHHMFSTLYKSEDSIRLASHIGRSGALFIMLGAFSAICKIGLNDAWLTGALALSGISAISTLNWSNKFTENVYILKIALRNRMRAGSQYQHNTPAALNVVEEKELDRLFRTYAPGRDYFTAYDLGRMNELEYGKNPLIYWFKWLSNRFILMHHADLIVEEDRKLVPAITKASYIRVIRGVAKLDVAREKKEGKLELNIRYS